MATPKKAKKSKAANPGESSVDLQADQAADTQAMAAAMPHNENKASEYGRRYVTAPRIGATVESPSFIATASTVSEERSTAKSGIEAEPGENPLNDSLDRVRVDPSARVLTTNQGVPIGDNQHSLKAGLRGPALLEDFILREKITHFDHERIPERIVHARGSGAHGFFEAYGSMKQFTRAAPFQEQGKVTPVFVRFSTVAGGAGSKDTARDARGFAVKFYTDQGNWDLVGNNIPVFFIQDAMKFPDLVHAVKQEPHHGMPQAASAHDTFWDFVSLMPESTHMLMWVMSDRAIPRSLRMMQGFGVHTFRLVNEDGVSSFCKFHWTPRLGTHSLTWDEAVKISGADPDFHRRDLWEAIENGCCPEWELGMQIFTEEQADAFSFDVLDPTKLVPEELVPVTPVGRMVLNRNPDNFFAETEQVAFCAAHIIPGIDFSNDPLLAGRIHSYVDTQISRLGGPNFQEIPINAPIAPVHNNQRDGMHRQAIHRGRVSYEPNSLGGGCPFQAGAAGFVSFPQPVQEDKVRGNPEKFADHYTQATLFYNSQSPVEKSNIAAAFRFELSKLTVPAIRQRMLSSLLNVSKELASSVAEGLGMELPAPMPRALPKPAAPEVKTSRRLSLMSRPGDGGIRTRRVAVLVAEGVDGNVVTAVVKRLKKEGAVPKIVSTRIGPVKTSDGGSVEANASMENEPSFLFDALILTDGEPALTRLAADGHTMEYIKDQYRHLKTILALGRSGSLLLKAGIPSKLPDGEADPGLLSGESRHLSDALDLFVEAAAHHKHFLRHSDPPRV